MRERGASAGVVVVARGEVSPDERTYAQRKIERLESLVRVPVLFARVELTRHADPARQQPSIAKAELDVNGKVLHAHAAATTMHEAVDMLEARMRERLDRSIHRDADTRRRVPGQARP